MQDFYSRELFNRRKVAQCLGRSESWFRANFNRLKSQGFPDPVPNCGLRWDPKAIAYWLDQQINTKLCHNDNYSSRFNSWEDELIARVKIS